MDRITKNLLFSAFYQLYMVGYIVWEINGGRATYYLKNKGFVENGIQSFPMNLGFELFLFLRQ